MFPAIFLASVLFDRGSGLYSTVLSTVLLYFEAKPTGTFLLPAGLVLPMVIFVVVALGLAVISERLRTAYQRAAEAERAKDLLLQELSHRTKNNLAMVSSLLSLQARMKSSPEAREALEKAYVAFTPSPMLTTTSGHPATAAKSKCARIWRSCPATSEIRSGISDR
ncbi:histidine kinase dimerization/phosphoacceptor domain -containing protein [Mesorhizobium sp. M0166]|uniref:histidine kinase dimerization/phosphoacceptor domain -containing protein n=1 Tax=unclassified Mesorhizobium TaxID=325217 RepID=UPI0033389496